MRKVTSLRGLVLSLLVSSALFSQTNFQILPTTPTNFEAFTGEFFTQTFSCPACPANTVISLSAQIPLPAGLSYNQNTRTLSGTSSAPNQGSAFSIIATSNNQQLTFRSYSIATDRRLFFLTNETLPAATAGIAMTRTVNVNLSSAWDTGTRDLPTSISVSIPSNSTTATLSGVFPAVTVPTAYSLQLYASYPPGSTSQNVPSIFQTINRIFAITVNPPPTLTANLPPGQVGVPYGANVTTTGGTAPFTYSSVGNMPPGIGLNGTTGFLSGIPQTNGTFSFQISVRDANGASAFATATVTVTGTPLQITSLTFPAARVAQSYLTQLTVLGGTAPFAWSIVSPTLPPPGIGISQATLTGIPNTIGLFQFTIRVVDSVGVAAQANVSLAVNPALLTISSTSLPTGIPGAPYQASLSATGGNAPYVWTLGSGALPAGITLAPNGLLTGTPTTAGTATFSVRVTDTPSGLIGYPGGAATQNFTLTVGTGVLSIVPTALPAALVGQAFASTLTATGGIPPYSWSVSAGTLPAGVTLGTNGVFSGTPTTAGPSNFTVQVRDSVNATATRDFAVTATAGLNISTATLDDAVVNIAYNLTLAAQNGTAPFTYSVASGALPAGITLTSAGIFTGIPTAAGSFDIVVQVVDRGNLAATKAFTLVVRLALSIVTSTLDNGNVGAGYTAQIVGGGGFPPYTFALATGPLPAGLALASSGALTGTPTTAGTFPVSVRVTDARSFTATRSFTIVITQVSLPTVTVTQVTDTTTAASQPTFGVSLATPFPTTIDGTVSLAFQPESGPTDPDVRFSNGGNSLNFTIPAGQTTGVAPAGTPFTFASGTTAGTITLTVVLRSNGQVLAPNPAAVRTIRLNRAGPTITNVRINRTAAGFEVLVTGYSNTREVSGGNLRFNPAPGVTLSAVEFPLNLGAVFQTWFVSGPSASFGTQFLLTIPFTVADGTAASLNSVLVTLTNGAGSGSGLGNF